MPLRWPFMVKSADCCLTRHNPTCQIYRVQFAGGLTTPVSLTVGKNHLADHRLPLVHEI